jgi:hypothetical protein
MAPVSCSVLCRRYRLSSLSSDVVAPLRLGPLFHCCFPGLSVVSSRGPLLRVSSWSTVPSWCLTTVSLTQCRNGTAKHRYAGGGQLLPGTTTALGPFLRLTKAPYFYIPVPVSLLQYFDTFTAAFSLGTSSRTAVDSISSEAGSLLSRQPPSFLKWPPACTLHYPYRISLSSSTSSGDSPTWLSFLLSGILGRL